MAKTIIEGFIFLYTPMSTRANPSYTFHESDISGEHFIKVGAHTIEADVPDDFDPVPQQIAALTEQKRLKRLKLAEELASIDDRISKLSALTFEPAEVVTVDDDEMPF